MADLIEFRVWELSNDPEPADTIRASSPAAAAETFVESELLNDDIQPGERMTVCVQSPDGTVTTWDCAVELRILTRQVLP